MPTLRSVMHPSGSHRFLPAISPYSAGFAANPGFEITALQLGEDISLHDGFRRIDRELARRNLPLSALAGLQLRSPALFSFPEFEKFNNEYNNLLNERSLIIDGVNPISRTNVIPLDDGPSQPIIHLAFIVHPSISLGGEDFVVAGAGEIPGNLDPKNIVAHGDLSPSGMNEKVNCVLDIMNERLNALDKDNSQPRTVNIYTIHEIANLANLIKKRFSCVAQSGMTSWITKPPVVEVEFEMDCYRNTNWIKI